MASSPVSQSTIDGFVRVFRADDVPVNGNRCVLVENRGVVIYRRFNPMKDSSGPNCNKGSRFYALDATCYHMGGPLKDVTIVNWCVNQESVQAAIEDIGGQDVASCPWHRWNQ